MANTEAGKIRLVPDCENEARVYLDMGDGLRLIFWGGRYMGYYTSQLKEALS